MAASGRYFNLFIGTGEGDLRPVLRIRKYLPGLEWYFSSTAPLTAMIGLEDLSFKNP